MSQTDPKVKKPDASTAAVPQAGNASKPPENAKPGSPRAKSGGNSWILALVVIVVAAAAVSALVVRSSRAPAPVASASEEMEATDLEGDSESATDEEMAEEIEETADVEAVKEATPTPRAATTGTLVVRSDVEGAAVLLNGKRVGTTPHQAKDLAPGSYQVKVEKDGYEPYQENIQVTAKRLELIAKLVPASVMLRIETNVPGAKIVIDGEERGTTPLALEDLPPGRYQLTVSASGYRTHSETLELTGGAREVSVDLVSPLADLHESVAVKHKHRLGACEGVLRATASGIVYESDHKDAFSVELDGVSEIELDRDDLSLKVENGRSYNFNERNDNDDALSRFFERVKEAVQLSRETS